MEARPEQITADSADAGRGSRPRRRLMLAGVAVILATIGGLVLAGHLAGSAPSSSGTVPGVGGPTAREVLDSAAEVAEQWAGDAQLAAVSCRWTEVAASPAAEAEWTFQFFSPSVQRLALVAASGGEARLVRDALSPYVVPTFSTSEWRVDSDEALQVWWSYAGRSLLARHPGADVVAQLRVSGEHGMQLVWFVVGLVGDQDDPVATVVSGVDGTLVE